MIIKWRKLHWVMMMFCVPAMPAFAKDGFMEGAVRLLIDTDGKLHVQIRGGSYFFEPAHIIATANVPLEVLVTREWGIVPHTFVLEIPESGIRVDESLSMTPKTVIFTPTVIGRFEYYCRTKVPFFKTHGEKGMKGILEVVP